MDTSPSLNALSALQNTISVDTALFDEYAAQSIMIFGRSMIMFICTILKWLLVPPLTVTVKTTPYQPMMQPMV
jgi:hypothetical protein